MQCNVNYLEFIPVKDTSPLIPLRVPSPHTDPLTLATATAALTVHLSRSPQELW